MVIGTEQVGESLGQEFPSEASDLGSVTLEEAPSIDLQECALLFPTRDLLDRDRFPFASISFGVHDYWASPRIDRCSDDGCGVFGELESELDRRVIRATDPDSWFEEDEFGGLYVGY